MEDERVVEVIVVLLPVLLLFRGHDCPTGTSKLGRCLIFPVNHVLTRTVAILFVADRFFKDRIGALVFPGQLARTLKAREAGTRNNIVLLLNVEPPGHSFVLRTTNRKFSLVLFCVFSDELARGVFSHFNLDPGAHLTLLTGKIDIAGHLIVATQRHHNRLRLEIS